MSGVGAVLAAPDVAVREVDGRGRGAERVAESAGAAEAAGAVGDGNVRAARRAAGVGRARVRVVAVERGAGAGAGRTRVARRARVRVVAGECVVLVGAPGRERARVGGADVAVVAVQGGMRAPRPDDEGVRGARVGVIAARVGAALVDQRVAVVVLAVADLVRARVHVGAGEGVVVAVADHEASFLDGLVGLVDALEELAGRTGRRDGARLDLLREVVPLVAVAVALDDELIARVDHDGLAGVVGIDVRHAADAGEGHEGRNERSDELVHGETSKLD